MKKLSDRGLFAVMMSMLLTGCALFGMPPTMQDYSAMSAAQIKAAVADKESSCTCSEMPTPWGVIKTRHCSTDKGVISAAGGEASAGGDNCGVKIELKPKAPKAAP